MHTRSRRPGHTPLAILAVALVVIAIGAGTAAVVSVTSTLSSPNASAQGQADGSATPGGGEASSNGADGGPSHEADATSDDGGGAGDAGQSEASDASEGGNDEGDGGADQGHPTELSQTEANSVVTAPSDLPEGLDADEAVRAVSLWLDRHDLTGVVSCAPDANGVASYPNVQDPSQPYALPWWHYVTTGTDGSRTEFWLVYDPYEMGPYCTDQSPEGSTQS